jgi:hypothetical protein
VSTIVDAILPLTRRPGPIFRFCKSFHVHGHPVQVVGERWAAEDAGHAPVATEPDSQRPGVVIAIYVRDLLTGAIIPPASCEGEAWVSDIQAGGRGGRR